MAIESELTADLAPPAAAPARPQRGRAAARDGARQLIELYRPRFGGFVVLLGYVLVAALVYAGWQQRLEWPLTAEHGIGYALGIVGGTLMLLLLLYPLRKHVRAMRHFGSVRFWFRTHMLFGVLGPVLILFHCGFQPGSLNSNVALLCMLTVASSGLVGRYFYTRIHHGLYGQKATLEEIRRHSQLLGETLHTRLATAPWLLARIESFEQRVARHGSGFCGSLWMFLSLGVRTWTLYLRFLVHTARIRRRSDRKRLERLIGAYLSGIRKVAEFHVYERLFSIWHVLHFPLFLMLVVSGVVHVIAVHMY